MADLLDKSYFHTVIYSPNYKGHLEYSGRVKSLSSTNSEGNFDILPLHENFVSIVDGPVLIVDENGEKKEINVERAIVEASDNIVKVFVEF